MKFTINKRMKCLVCKKKRCVINCKCGKYLCLLHRFPDKHNCTFNYRKEHKQILKDKLPSISPLKVQKI